MELIDVNKSSISECLENLKDISKYREKLLDLSEDLKDSIWTGMMKNSIKNALEVQCTLIDNFITYLNNCTDSLSLLDSYKEQANISSKLYMSVYNCKLLLDEGQFESLEEYNVSGEKYYESLLSEYNSSVSKQNELEQSLKDAFDAYVLTGNSTSLQQASSDSRIYNIDKIKDYLEDFRNLIAELSSSYSEPFSTGYISSCDNDVVQVLKTRINKYFEIMGENNLKILSKWTRMVNALKKIYQSTNEGVTGSYSGYSNQEMIMPELIIIDENNPFITIPSLPGTISSENLASNAEVEETIEEVEYPDITIGSSVGNFDVSKGHMTAADAVNQTDVKTLLSQYVNEEESIFNSFATVNEDGTVSNIEKADGMTLQEYCEKYGVDIGSVAVDVARKDGVSQAWISVEELNSSNNEIDEEDASIGTTSNNTETPESVPLPIVSEYNGKEYVVSFAIVDSNGDVKNEVSSSKMTFDEYCSEYNVDPESVSLSLDDTGNTWITIKELIEATGIESSDTSGTNLSAVSPTDKWAQEITDQLLKNGPINTEKDLF